METAQSETTGDTKPSNQVTKSSDVEEVSSKHNSLDEKRSVAHDTGNMSANSEIKQPSSADDKTEKTIDSADAIPTEKASESTNQQKENTENNHSESQPNGIELSLNNPGTVLGETIKSDTVEAINDETVSNKAIESKQMDAEVTEKKIESVDGKNTDEITVESGDGKNTDEITVEFGDGKNTDGITVESGDDKNTDEITVVSGDGKKTDGITVESGDGKNTDGITVESGDGKNTDEITGKNSTELKKIETANSDGPEASMCSNIETESSVNDGPPSGINAECRDESIEKVWTGFCPFTKIPPLPKKVVRIFVSSTFTDTKEERNALMQYVYPQLAEYCRDKHGLEFQVVDMRWGVPEQASDNHSTSELCIQEIRKCQEVSVGPNFVALIGDKYGYRPIPSAIHRELFESLKLHGSSISEGGCDWSLVEEWYLCDANSVPPVYILQPISAKIQHYHDTANPELRKEAWDKWNTVNKTLTSTLRHAAEAGHKQGNVSEEDKHLFFMSVTENEIRSGLNTEYSKPEDSCFCIIRKIQDIAENLHDPKAPRFADVLQQKEFDLEAKTHLEHLRDSKVVKVIPESNINKLDIEWQASGAKISLGKFRDVDVAKLTQHFSETQVTQYKEYLENVCSNFFNRITKLIHQAGTKQRSMYDNTTSEILQHWHLAKLRCEIFEGRDEILSQVKTYLANDVEEPVMIFGNSGCGKTSVMAKIMEQVANGIWRSDQNYQFAIVARFLGTTPNTSNVHQLLVAVCEQLARVYDTKFEEPDKFSELTKEFHKLLSCANDAKPLVVLLDSIDQLMPVYNAFKMTWLPEKLPKHVKLVISTIDEGYTICKNAKERYGAKITSIQINPLGEKLGLEVIKKWLDKDTRTMTAEQEAITKQALQKCSLPLYARIVYDQIKKWKSYDVPGIDQLETTVRGAINKLYLSLEEKFGVDIVKHCLSYLTTTRHGISEVELEHVLSLDDLLLNKVFKFWNPPIRRIPPLLWTRIRTELHSYIVERSADDTLVLCWYHRQFIEATKERYLKDQEFARYISSNLVEYFSGVWGKGREKPFKYTEAQVKRFAFTSADSKADRKVPAQPFIFRGTGEEDIRFNKRKLSELPFHLIKCKDYKELKKSVFFNYSWLYAKLKSTSVMQLIEEFEVFMQADKTMKKDVEMKNLYANLQLIRPYVARYPNSLAYELTGRLAKFAGKSENVTSLLIGCDSMGLEHCPITPLVTCFETADIGLSQNITFRKSEPWQEGGAFTCSEDFRSIFILDYDDRGMPIIHHWDMTTGEKVNTFPIIKVRDEKDNAVIDVYIQLEISKNGKFLIGFYKQKYVGDYKHRFKNHGFVDFIDKENGTVVKSYDGFLYREEYSSPLQYMTENHFCVRFGWKVPLYNFTEDTKKELNRPTLLSPDEKYFIICGQKKTELREFASKEPIGEFDTAETQLAIAAASDFSLVAMIGSETKQLKIFDLGKKQLHANKRYGFLLKSKKVFTLEQKVKNTVADLFKPVVETNAKGETEEKTNNRVTMEVAADNRHLLVIFRGTVHWVGYIWNMGRWNAKFVGAITDRMELSWKYPKFNHDGAYVVHCKEKMVFVHSTEDAELVNSYEMTEAVKDFCVSQTSNKVVVMLQKTVQLLNITKSDVMVSRHRTKRNTLNDRSSVLLEREINTSFIHKEVIIRPESENVVVEELLDLGMVTNTDRLASAKSKVKFAVDKRVSPDGLKTIHYHTCVQVVDTKAEEIKYSPKKGDVLLRVSKQVNGVPTNESIAIPGLEPGGSRSIMLELIQGDRIVNENNKVKFRVNQEPNGQFKIMNIPSVITVYTSVDEKLRRLQRITVYGENILTVSNKFVVTEKKGTSAYFVKVYDLVTGKDMATHEVSNGCDCAKFSFDEVQLFVVDRKLQVRVFIAPDYNSLEQKIPLFGDQAKVPYIAKDVLTFREDRDSVIVVYGSAGHSSSVRNRYMHVHLVTKVKSPEMEMKPTFEDISKDGLVGIDGRLDLYDIPSAKVIQRMAYAGLDVDKTVSTEDMVPQGTDNIFLRKLRYNDPIATMQLRVRISDDKRYIVYVDKQDDTLHIAKMIGDSVKHIFSCHTHLPRISLSHGLDIRYYGRILVLRSEDSVLPFAIRDVNDTQKGNVNHESELLRALSLVDSVWATATQTDLPNKDRLQANELFLRRYSLREEDSEDTIQDEEQEMDEKQKIFQAKSSTKPTVLIVAGSLFAQFKPSRFTQHLDTSVKSVVTAEEATKKINTLAETYDAIVLQLVTDDVKHFDVKVCTDHAISAVDAAVKKAQMVVFSQPTLRIDSQELNQKSVQVYQNVSTHCAALKNVHCCENTNVSEGGKPIHKFYKDGVNLSLIGVKQVAMNIKSLLQKVLEMDII